MAAVPVIITGICARRDKTEEPYPVTITGIAQIAGLEVGGGPILPEPPDEKPPEPPLTIWPKPGDPDMPFPEPPIPPIDPPAAPVIPHEGWNWSALKSGWYYIYVPKPGDAQPKRPAKK